jgi:hypothetical protein
MTSGRLGCIIVYELHRAGYLNTSTVNGPAKVVEEAINARIRFGDVKCIPDEDELNELHGFNGLVMDED